MTYLAMGEDVPKLPSFEEMEIYPHATDIDNLSLLKNITWTSYFAPSISTSDIDMESPEFAKMNEEVSKKFIEFAGLPPFYCMSFAPYDFISSLELHGLLYADTDSMMTMKTFENKCDGITRFQLESVAVGYAGAVSCDF